MVLLTGKNLGQRQRELNLKVAEVVANKRNFSEIKDEEETTDIDKLYKIDIASQYRDIEYIVDVLKSGDSLYISRALKCVWLYEEAYSHVINVENIHDNIFPYMSLKMKAKMLSTISMHVRKEDRAATFYTYCKNKMPGIAIKFLNFTSEEFKLDAIKKEEVNILHLIDTQKKLKHFVGNSFLLGITCIEPNDWQRKKVIHNLRFLYTVCNENYLDILENYEVINLTAPNSLNRLGIRISKDIMIKHKSRVLNNPLLYVNKLNKSMLTKHSTSEDAKKMIANLMPQHVTEFWRINVCKAYSYMLDLIPMNEKFAYIKELFNCKYLDEGFEMTLNFYKLKYFEMLSVNERELWALRHINSDKEMLGSGNDYKWYKFVKLDKAFVEIKKYIMITPDNDKRSDMLNILVESVRDQTDLLKLLNYYYERHVNESTNHKENFINKVLSVHNVFEFNTECWEALNKLFYSLDIYTVGNYSSNKTFRAIAVACHILHNKDMPQALVDFVDVDINYWYFQLLLEKMGKNKSEIIFQYILKLFVEKLQPFEQDPYNEKVRRKVEKYVYNINNLLKCFHKGDEDCPKIVTQFMELHSPKTVERKKITSGDMFRLLKKDAKLSVEILSELADDVKYWPKRWNRVLRKLKVYFPNDVAKEYIEFFNQWLPKLTDNYSTFNPINTVVYGIFVLADESLKVDLMEKYKPLAAKIDHSVTDRKVLYIQEAICRLVSYCRPPMPLQNVLKYIKGDYIHYCMPMFDMYLANLPLPKAIEFTEATLNAPLSVQKHSLRLAFRCYSSNNLKDLVLKVWKKTKNVSLRMLIYKSLYNKIIKADEDTQAELYEVLKLFTSDLHKDDHHDLFNLINSDRMPDRFIDDYLQTGWNMVIKLPEKSVNINRQTSIIKNIEQNFNLINREFIYKRIIKEHIHELLINRRLRPPRFDEMQCLYDAKWDLTARYIIQCRNSEEMEENMKLLSFIFENCLEIWNELYNGNDFVSRTFYYRFVKTIKLYSLELQRHCSVHIFQHIIEMLQTKLPYTEIYLTLWDLQISIYVVKSETVQCDRGENYEDTRSPLENISVNFANQIGNFVKELVEKQQFYTIFLKVIADLIQNGLLHINGILEENIDSQLMFYESLTNLEMKETHLITLLLLPVDIPLKLKPVHTRILRKVHAFKNDEVKTFLYSKFTLLD